jgi:hypothetical protein
MAEAALYAYAYPEPAGTAAASIRPAAAFYHPEMREWILPYDTLRSASDPDGAIVAFLESTYETAATLGGWDIDALAAETATNNR